MTKYLLLIIFLILLYFLNCKKIENYEIEKYEIEDQQIIPSNEFRGYLDIYIDVSVIIKMNDMKDYIDNQSHKIPNIYNNLPNNYKNRQTYIQILYETFVDDFLDVYIVNRFNAHKFLNIIYKYPSYKDINDKYPKDKIKKNYDKIFNEFLSPSIKYLYENVNKNLNKKYFDFTIKNVNKKVNNFKSKMETLDANKFNSFYSTELKEYFIKILNNLNIIYENECNKNEMFPFLFTFKKLNDDNQSEIFELINDILENENRFIDINQKSIKN